MNCTNNFSMVTSGTKKVSTRFTHHRKFICMRFFAFHTFLPRYFFVFRTQIVRSHSNNTLLPASTTHAHLVYNFLHAILAQIKLAYVTVEDQFKPTDALGACVTSCTSSIWRPWTTRQNIELHSMKHMAQWTICFLYIINQTTMISYFNIA